MKKFVFLRSNCCKSQFFVEICSSFGFLGEKVWFFKAKLLEKSILVDILYIRQSAANGIAIRKLTDADILSEETDFLAVVEQRTIAVQESAGSVRHRVVIQMVQLAVVLQFAAVLSEQIRPAHKLILHFARPLTSRPITRLQFK